MAFELKGAMAPLTVLRLLSGDLGLIQRQLRVKVSQMPQFFHDAPIVIDVGLMEGAGAGLSFAALVEVLRFLKLVPVGIINVTGEVRRAAVEAGLGVIAPPQARNKAQNAGRPATGESAAAAHSPQDPRRGSGDAPSGARGAAGRQAAPASSDEATPTPAPTPVPARTATPAAGAPSGRASTAAQAPSPAPAPAPHGGPLVVTQAVRSGQVIYAQNNDLVVLAPVNPGAQVVADGHVHIYAPLRGRAMAGAQGLQSARIFCQKLEAELVCIAGAYLTPDDIPANQRGKSAQVFLHGDECRITTL
jgi:septum site-determining protein MinC